MDVDKTSYSFVLEDFELSVQKCDFCAIDQEMTGISCVEEPQSWDMNVSDLYRLSRKVVDRYIAFQFGAALFTLLEDGNYEVKPFNFYLIKGSGDFQVNAGCLNFLSRHNIDFIKWIKSGIPYHNSQEEAEIVEKNSLNCSDDESGIVDGIVSEIEKWFHESTEETTVLKKMITMNDEKNISSKIEANQLCVFIEYTRENKYDLPTEIKISRVLSEQNRAYITQKRTREKLWLRDALGFREFWKCLTKSKKPIIGHNFFTDLLFMIHMHEAPLAAEYENFKREAHELFPVIYDTKTLAHVLQGMNVIKVSYLSGLFNECVAINEKRSDPISFRYPPGYHSYDKKSLNSLSRAHEAGYDAYMTGVVFSIMKVIFRGLDKCNIVQWENIISIYMSCYFMNLKGEDILKEKNVFAVEFDRDIDWFLARALFLSEGKLKSTETSKELGILDFQMTMKNSRKRDRVVIVNFEDEMKTEECVKSRIDMSVRRLKNSFDRCCQEEGASFPQYKSIRRLL